MIRVPMASASMMRPHLSRQRCSTSQRATGARSRPMFTRLEDKSEPGRSPCSIFVLQHGQNRSFGPTGPTSRARQARFPNRHLGAIGIKALIAFDLDGTLADSKQPLDERMGQALADLLAVAEVAIISGGDWPQFDKQVASRLPARAYRGRLWLLPTTGTKLYRYDGTWRRAYAELFRSEEHTSELQSLMRISYAVFCLKKKKNIIIKRI